MGIFFKDKEITAIFIGKKAISAVYYGAKHEPQYGVFNGSCNGFE